MPIAGGGELLIKCEHEQVTGSFKARGAMNRLLTLSAEQLARGVVNLARARCDTLEDFRSGWPAPMPRSSTSSRNCNTTRC